MSQPMFQPLARLPVRFSLATLGAVCALSVGAALFAQHKLGMEPCPWCILQRMLFIAMALVGLLSAAWPSRWVHQLGAGLVLPVALGGVAAALWQHFVAAQSSSCALTLADRIISALGLDGRWPDVFEVRASCAEAAVKVLGVPFEFWSLALFAAVAVVSLACLLAPARRA